MPNLLSSNSTETFSFKFWPAALLLLLFRWCSFISVIAHVFSGQEQTCSRFTWLGGWMPQMSLNHLGGHHVSYIFWKLLAPTIHWPLQWHKDRNAHLQARKLQIKNIAHAAWVFQSLCVFRNLSIYVFAYIIFSEKIYQSKSYAQLFERASRRNI